jgi:hypothetical protein
MTMGFAAEGMRALAVHQSPPSAPDSEPTLADMVDWIGRQGPASGAETLRQLRVAFPDSPLALRVAALNMLIRRRAATPATGRDKPAALDHR